MNIRNHKLVGATFLASPNYSKGKTVIPELIVVHDTAGRNAISSIKWLRSKESRASAHLLIARNGDVFQLVNLNRKAWHAGKSEWKGRFGVNNFSLGIELENYGKMEPTGVAGAGRAWWGQVIPGDEVDFASTPEHGSGMWQPYSEAQLEKLFFVLKVLKAKYPTITDCVGHYQVSPGRKVDPNPLFPMYYASGTVASRQ